MQEERLYVVAYDIPCDRRRAKVHNILSGYGKWTQYSVFELFLTPKQLVQLRNKLDRVLNAQEDSLRLYPLCAACQKAIETIGLPPPEAPEVFLV